MYIFCSFAKMQFILVAKMQKICFRICCSKTHVIFRRNIAFPRNCIKLSVFPNDRLQWEHTNNKIKKIIILKIKIINPTSKKPMKLQKARHLADTGGSSTYWDMAIC